MHKDEVADNIRQAMLLLESHMRPINTRRADKLKHFVEESMDMPEWLLAMRPDVWKKILHEVEAINADLTEEAKTINQQLDSVKKQLEAML